jgi:hypothetical protein
VRRRGFLGLVLASGVAGCSSCKDDKADKPRSDPKGDASPAASASAPASGSAGPLFPRPPDNMMVLCPKCMKPYPPSEIHVAPVYNEGLKKYVPSHRCDGHYKEEMAATRKRLEVAGEKEVEAFLAMARYHGNEDAVKKIAGDKKGREAALAVLTAMEKGELEPRF